MNMTRGVRVVRGRLGSIVRAHADLAGGDLGLLYLAWLLFAKRVREIRVRYANRPALLERLNRAGLPGR